MTEGQRTLKNPKDKQPKKGISVIRFCTHRLSQTPKRTGGEKQEQHQKYQPLEGVSLLLSKWMEQASKKERRNRYSAQQEIQRTKLFFEDTGSPVSTL